MTSGSLDQHSVCEGSTHVGYAVGQSLGGLDEELAGSDGDDALAGSHLPEKGLSQLVRSGGDLDRPHGSHSLPPQASSRTLTAGCDSDREAPVLAASRWRSNAELIADCARLHYLRADWVTLDPTYGRGVWWKAWRPDRLVTCTDRLVPTGDETCTYHGVDFRDLPMRDNSFDAVAYDPPYVSIGGRKTTGIADMHDRFGLTHAPTSPAGVQQLINDGLTEMLRVVKPRGIVLAKCQDYVSSGRLWPGTHHTLTHALDLGFELLDRFEHVTHPRPQPARARQVHARRNLSTLFVFRKTR